MRIASAVVSALVLGASGCSLAYTSERHTRNHSRDDAGIRSDAGAPGPVPDVQFCQEMVERYCRGRLACCPTAAESMGQCVSDTFPECNAALASFLADPRNGYDASVAREVAVEYGALADQCDADVVDFLRSVDGALRVFRGTLPEGADCGDRALRAACERPSFCRRQSALGWACGPLSAEGAQCGADVECEASLWCERAVTGLRCAARQAEGETCARGFACESGVCSGSRCVARSPDGAWCASPFAAFQLIE